MRIREREGRKRGSGCGCVPVNIACRSGFPHQNGLGSARLALQHPFVPGTAGMRVTSLLQGHMTTDIHTKGQSRDTS